MHPKGEYLAAADDSGVVKVYSTRTRRVHKTLRNAHTVRVRVLSIETVEYHVKNSKPLHVCDGKYFRSIYSTGTLALFVEEVYSRLLLVLP